MPKVSVIVPVYNVERYIERCLQSLIHQTLEDIEIIVINDGSTDASESVINRYLKNYSNKIKYIRKLNGGLSDARNCGLQFATGQYVAFLDSDDYVDITIYEKMYNKAVEEDCDYVECDFIWKYDKKEVRDCGKNYKDRYEMLATARVVAWNKLIKREIITNNNLTFPKGLRYEDVDFFGKLVPHINKIGFVNECLVYYTQREDSIIKTQNEKTADIFKILDDVLDYYGKLNIYKEFSSSLEYLYTRILLCSSFLRVVKIKDRKVRKKQLEETWIQLNKRFPNWQKNRVLQRTMSKKNIYMRTVNKVTYRIYAVIFRIFGKSN